MRNKVTLAVVTVVTVLALITLSSTAAATVNVEVNEEYRGGEQGNDQGVEIEYTLSPEGNDITDVRIQIDRTVNSFIDHDSYVTTVDPGDADVEVESVGQGVFEISELQLDEEVTIEFVAYPRDIQPNQLDVAVVRTEYVQRGQDLSEETTVTADLSSSPTIDSGGGVGFLAFLLGLVIGGVGGAGAVWKIKEDETEGITS